MSRAEFERRMPDEFWREVVDRVAAEVPDTLLLAEAFWLLEGYFVRTLGMHRVYNSAFMHMLRDEDNAGYRKVIRDTLEFDPEILKRYVNFMTNPDEETAVEQFGDGDKYFGVATLLATLPGLPMLGHGQVEGFGEKYGMEFRRATLDERPNDGPRRPPRARDRPAPPRAAAVRRRRRLPAVRRRDRRRRRRRGRLRLLERARPRPVAGRLPQPVRVDRRLDPRLRAVRAQGGRRLEDGSCAATLAEALGLPTDDGAFVAFRDARSGLEYLRSAGELRERGLFVELDAYRCLVFGEFREVRRRRAGRAVGASSAARARRPRASRRSTTRWPTSGCRPVHDRGRAAAARRSTDRRPTPRVGAWPSVVDGLDRGRGSTSCGLADAAAGSGAASTRRGRDPAWTRLAGSALAPTRPTRRREPGCGAIAVARRPWLARRRRRGPCASGRRTTGQGVDVRSTRDRVRTSG